MSLALNDPHKIDKKCNGAYKIIWYNTHEDTRRYIRFHVNNDINRNVKFNVDDAINDELRKINFTDKQLLDAYNTLISMKISKE